MGYLENKYFFRIIDKADILNMYIGAFWNTNLPYMVTMLYFAVSIRQCMAYAGLGQSPNVVVCCASIHPSGHLQGSSLNTSLQG